jgi:carboxymethylenebutenolidase
MKHRFLCLAVAFAAALPAHAQDWAKAAVESSPRHQEWVTVKHGDRSVQCFIAYPEVKDRAPVVIVIHEIFGLSDWARDVTDELAAAGYIAITPDLLSGMAPGGGGTDKMGGQSAVMKAISMLPADQVTADLNAVAEYARSIPAANGTLAVAGFCWGGGQSFRFATNRTDLKAAYVFYGQAPDQVDASRIQCPVYGFYGGNDARISATVPATGEMMKKLGKTYDPVVYDGAGHGFMRAGEDPKGLAGNKQAQAAAWARWKALLAKL